MELKENRSWRLAIAIFFLTWIFSYGNRVILSPLLNEFETLWQLSPSQLGYVSGALFLGYFLFQIPSGLIADAWSRKKTLIVGLFIQGAAVILSGFADSMTTFMIARFLTGVAQATLFTCCFSILSTLIPVKRRVIGMALTHSGMSVGMIYGLVFSSQMTYNFGFHWGTSFVFSGIGTILTAVAVYLLLKNHDEEKQNGTGNNFMALGKNSLKYVMKNRNIRWISIVAFLEGYGMYVIFTWLPYYLKMKGFGDVSAGNIASLATFLSGPGCILMALMADRITRRKPIIQLFMPITIITLFLVAYTSNMKILIAALLINGLFGRMTTAPLHITLVAESSSPENYSTSLSFFNSFSSASFFLAPVITGWILQITNRLEAGIYFALILQLSALLIMTFVVKETNSSNKDENQAIGFNNSYDINKNSTT